MLSTWSATRRPRAFLDAALRGGADMIQLRDKSLDDDGPDRRRARVPRRRRRGRRALHPQRPARPRRRLRAPTACTSARTTAAPAAARAAVGPDRIVGRSTHAPEQGAAADADPDVDYLAVGPVHATPTKPGRPAADSPTSRWAAANVTKPWFAIGGLDAANVGAVDRARRDPHRRRARDHRRRRPRGRGARAARAAGGGARWRSAAVSAATARGPRRGGRRRRTRGREAPRLRAQPRARRGRARRAAAARARASGRAR